MVTVVTGLERVLRDGPAAAGLAAGARVGLLCHQASVDSEGVHALSRMRPSDGWRIERLFAPEHGVWGIEQDMQRVADGTDPRTALPVISLYGDDESSLRPSPVSLDGLDAILCDLQDVGSRYYTFVYTLSYVMEAAAALGLPVVVLDRPNPIGGTRVEGPVLDPTLSSFVGRFPLPVRHGMTIGELAGLFRDRFGLACDLRIVRAEGWRRSMHHEETGLPWVPPSPNMPTPTTARVYPGGCLVEGTELSEGRGTTTPFELVGAPWLDGAALAESLRSTELPGVAFRAATFRPMFQKHAGRACGGVQVIERDRDSFRPFETYLALLREARRIGGDEFGWRDRPYEFVASIPAIDLLLGRTELRPMLEAGATLTEMEGSWSEGLREFVERRAEHLLYR